MSTRPNSAKEIGPDGAGPKAKGPRARPKVPKQSSTCEERRDNDAVAIVDEPVGVPVPRAVVVPAEAQEVPVAARDEIPEMSQLHALSIPRGYGSQTYKVFVLDARSTKCEPAETVWRICSSSSEFTRLGAIRTLGAHHGRRFRDWAGVCASDPRLRDSCRWLEVQFRAAGHEENARELSVRLFCAFQDTAAVAHAANDPTWW